MRLVKLDAIDSTNDYLKALCKNEAVGNFTIVTAAYQQNGKGQMESSWCSESDKNVIMSVLIKDLLPDLSQLFHLNVAVSVAVIDALSAYRIPLLSIKWPNDIMSGNKKIGGILIENTIKSNGHSNSIIGLGLNVNQMNFTDLPKATSLSLVTGITFDIEKMVVEIGDSIKKFASPPKYATAESWSAYTVRLFKKGIPMPFSDRFDNQFMGIILGVNAGGKLQLLLDDETVAAFDIKEIQMLY